MKKNTIIILIITVASAILLLTYVATEDTSDDEAANTAPQHSIASLPQSQLIETQITQTHANTSLVKPNKITHPPQHPENISADNEANKNKLFKTKNERITQDDNGNYLVDISTPGVSSKEWILSNSPIYFPSEDQLNNGIDGCAAGGYYVELKATLTLIVKTESGNTTYQYLCTHNHNSNMYFLEPYGDTKPQIQNSVDKLMTH
jgi:glucan-binding YG repeat protein